VHPTKGVHEGNAAYICTRPAAIPCTRAAGACVSGAYQASCPRPLLALLLLLLLLLLLAPAAAMEKRVLHC
jgi:hypothetical protein